MNRKLVLSRIAKFSFLAIKMLILPTETVFLAGIVFLISLGVTTVIQVPLTVSIGPLPILAGWMIIAIAISGILGIITRTVPHIWAAAKTGNRLFHKIPWKRNKKEPEPDYKYRPKGA